MIEIGIITYGEHFAFDEKFKLLKKYFPGSKILVLNNKENSAKSSQIQGSNTNYEFSGYLELSNCFSSTGPYLILNDTLFTSHITRGWLQLLRNFLAANKTKKQHIYGDLRYDGTRYEERPNPFLASWLFVVPDFETLKKFQVNLSFILADKSTLISSEYEAFLDHWISPTSKLKGWHGGPINIQIKVRKKRCIILEHRLSKLLNVNGMKLSSIGINNPFIYKLLRLADRINTRLIAFKIKSLH